MADRGVTYEKVSQAHVEALAATLRDDDAKELEAGGWERSLDAIIFSVWASELSLAVSFNGEVAAIAGVSAVSVDPDGVKSGTAWVLTSKVVNRFPVTFWRESRWLLAQFRQSVPRLQNAVDARYLKALRWAQRLGFDLGEVKPIGPNGEPFNVIRIGGHHA